MLNITQKLMHNCFKKSFYVFIILTNLILLNGCSTSTSDPYKNQPAKSIYCSGKNHLIKGQFPEALQAFEALEARYPYGKDSELGQLAIMFTYYKTADYAQTIAAADRFIRMYPRHKHVDYVYYIKGLAAYDDYISFIYQYFPMDRAIRNPEDGKKAFQTFKQLLEFYPNSCYACDAKARMIYLKNHLARHELHIAQYYFERKAYLATANRCQYILEYYDRTPTIPKALCLQIAAYRKLKLNQLACETQKIFDKNFSHTDHI